MCSLLPDKTNLKEKMKSFGVYIKKVDDIYASLNLDQGYNSMFSKDSPA